MAVRPLPSTGTIAISVLFFLLRIAAARTPSAFHVNEVTAADADVSDSLTVPISEINQILRLPSDAVSDVIGDDESSQSNTDPESAEPITVRSVPLTRVRFHDFRPIDRRHISVRSRLPNRLCRHHHFHIQPLLKPVDENMVSLTSDGGEEKKEELEPETVNWVRLPHHHHHHHRHHHHIYRHHNDDNGLHGFSKYLMKHSYKFGREKFKKQLIHKRRDHDDEEVKKGENGKKEARGGFVQQVRKFLAHI